MCKNESLQMLKDDYFSSWRNLANALGVTPGALSKYKKQGGLPPLRAAIASDLTLGSIDIAHLLTHKNKTEFILRTIKAEDPDTYL